ncbi:MAG: YicC/YloC family endoribonuclease [Pseudomonadota bacterium]
MTEAAVASMTGFARVDGAAVGRSFVWEVKSVNGRGLEPRFRLPSALDALEIELRAALTKALTRGSVSASLTLEKSAAAQALVIDETALDAAVAAIETVRSRIDCAPPAAEALLAMRGVLVSAEAGEEDMGALRAAVLSSFADALAALSAARAEEGARLNAVLEDQLAAIETLAASARETAAADAGAMRERLSARLADLAADVSIDPDRLAAEAALLVVKADVAEELNRLAAHVEAARGLLSAGGAIGRKLDFLCQEFNREANTLCSKAASPALKRIGLEMKTVVDQFREQVQNVE